MIQDPEPALIHAPAPAQLHLRTSLSTIFWGAGWEGGFEPTVVSGFGHSKESTAVSGVGHSKEPHSSIVCGVGHSRTFVVFELGTPTSLMVVFETVEPSSLQTF